MYAVTKVEVLYVPDSRGDIVEFVKDEDLPPVPFKPEDMAKVSQTVEIERVKCTEFHLGSRSIKIGLAEDAKQFLSIPFKVATFVQQENYELRKKMGRLRGEKVDLEVELSYYNNMNFWQALKFAFNKLV